MYYKELSEHNHYADEGTTATFECDPPVLFRQAEHGNAPLPGSRHLFHRFTHVTVCSFKSCESWPYGRTVVHASERLQGEKGFCYGALAEAWVLDGCVTPWAALKSFGYSDYADREEAA